MRKIDVFCFALKKVKNTLTAALQQPFFKIFGYDFEQSCQGTIKKNDIGMCVVDSVVVICFFFLFNKIQYTFTWSIEQCGSVLNKR